MIGYITADILTAEWQNLTGQMLQNAGHLHLSGVFRGHCVLYSQYGSILVVKRLLK